MDEVFLPKTIRYANTYTNIPIIEDSIQIDWDLKIPIGNYACYSLRVFARVPN